MLIISDMFNLLTNAESMSITILLCRFKKYFTRTPIEITFSLKNKIKNKSSS